MDEANPAQVEGASLDEAFRGTRRYRRIGQIVPSSSPASTVRHLLAA